MSSPPPAKRRRVAAVVVSSDDDSGDSSDGDIVVRPSPGKASPPSQRRVSLPARDDALFDSEEDEDEEGVSSEDDDDVVVSGRRRSMQKQPARRQKKAALQMRRVGRAELAHRRRTQEYDDGDGFIVGDDYDSSEEEEEDDESDEGDSDDEDDSDGSEEDEEEEDSGPEDGFVGYLAMNAVRENKRVANADALGLGIAADGIENGGWPAALGSSMGTGAKLFDAWARFLLCGLVLGRRSTDSEDEDEEGSEEVDMCTLLSDLPGSPDATLWAAAHRAFEGTLQTTVSSAVSSSAWSEAATQATSLLPCLSVRPVRSSFPPQCEVCCRSTHDATHELTFSGPLVDAQGLHSESEWVDALPRGQHATYSVKLHAGDVCTARLRAYHSGRFFKYRLLLQLSELVSSRVDRGGDGGHRSAGARAAATAAAAAEARCRRDFWTGAVRDEDEERGWDDDEGPVNAAAVRMIVKEGTGALSKASAGVSSTSKQAVAAPAAASAAPAPRRQAAVVVLSDSEDGGTQASTQIQCVDDDEEDDIVVPVARSTQRISGGSASVPASGVTAPPVADFSGCSSYAYGGAGSDGGVSLRALTWAPEPSRRAFLRANVGALKEWASATGSCPPRTCAGNDAALDVWLEARCDAPVGATAALVYSPGWPAPCLSGKKGGSSTASSARRRSRVFDSSDEEGGGSEEEAWWQLLFGSHAWKEFADAGYDEFVGLLESVRNRFATASRARERRGRKWGLTELRYGGVGLLRFLQHAQGGCGHPEHEEDGSSEDEDSG